MTKTLRLRRGVEADAKDMSDIYFDAFDDTFILKKCFPPESPSSKRWFEKYFLDAMEREAANVSVVVDMALPGREGQDGKVVAFATWVGPKNEDVSKKDEDEEEESYPADGDMELARVFFRGMHEAHLEIMGTEQHWSLSLIGTRKEAQGCGAGGMLIREGLKRVDDDGMRCFLDATVKGKPIYERFGFKSVKRLLFADGAIKQDCMIRGTQR